MKVGNEGGSSAAAPNKGGGGAAAFAGSSGSGSRSSSGSITRHPFGKRSANSSASRPLPRRKKKKLAPSSTQSTSGGGGSTTPATGGAGDMLPSSAASAAANRSASKPKAMASSMVTTEKENGTNRTALSTSTLSRRLALRSSPPPPPSTGTANTPATSSRRHPDAGTGLSSFRKALRATMASPKPTTTDDCRHHRTTVNMTPSTLLDKELTLSSSSSSAVAATGGGRSAGRYQQPDLDESLLLSPAVSALPLAASIRRAIRPTTPRLLRDETAQPKQQQQEGQLDTCESDSVRAPASTAQLHELTDSNEATTGPAAADDKKTDVAKKMAALEVHPTSQPNGEDDGDAKPSTRSVAFPMTKAAEITEKPFSRQQSTNPTAPPTAHIQEASGFVAEAPVPPPATVLALTHPPSCIRTVADEEKGISKKKNVIWSAMDPGTRSPTATSTPRGGVCMDLSDMFGGAATAKKAPPMPKDTSKPAALSRSTTREVTATIVGGRTGTSTKSMLPPTSRPPLTASRVQHHRQKQPDKTTSKDEKNWAERQCETFTNWLNYTLQPTEDGGGDNSDDQLPSADLSEERLAHAALLVHRHLAAARLRASELFRSAEMDKIRAVVLSEIRRGRISIRNDRNMYADLTMRNKILELLLSYSTPWLRIGLETLMGERIELESLSSSKDAEPEQSQKPSKSDHAKKKKPFTTTRGMIRSQRQQQTSKVSRKKQGPQSQTSLSHFFLTNVIHFTLLYISQASPMRLALKKFIIHRVLSDNPTLVKYTKGKCIVPSGKFEVQYDAEMRTIVLCKFPCFFIPRILRHCSGYSLWGAHNYTQIVYWCCSCFLIEQNRPTSWRRSLVCSESILL